MNKPEFINKLAEKHNITKKEATEIVARFNTTLEECLLAGETISFSGLYSMGVKEKQAREGVNPRSGDKILIPKMHAPYCKFGKTLKDSVKGD